MRVYRRATIRNYPTYSTGIAYNPRTGWHKKYRRGLGSRRLQFFN